MIQLTIALINFILGGLGVMFMFNGDFIPQPKTILVLSLILIVLYYGFKLYTKQASKKLDRLMYVSIGIYVSLLFSSFIYHSWKFDKLLSNTVMMKVVLFMLLLLSIYGNVLFLRAESSYKKKRGNQRIKETPEKTLLEKFRERNKVEDNQDVKLILGESAENED